MADDSNSWDNAIDEILNSSADDIPSMPVNIMGTGTGTGDGVEPNPQLTSKPAEEFPAPPPAPATTLPPSLFSRDSLPLAGANDASAQMMGRPSLFGNTNSLFGDSSKPPAQTILFGPSTAATVQPAHESDDSDDDDNVLDLLDSPAAVPAKQPAFSPSTATPAPLFSATATSTATAKPALSPPPQSPTSATNADDHDPPLPDFLSMISGTSRGAGSEGGDARARRRRLLNLAQGQFGSGAAGESNELTIGGSDKQHAPVVDPLAALLGGTKSPTAPAKVTEKDHVPIEKPATTQAVEQQIPRDPLAGLLKPPRQRAAGGTATTMGTLSDHPPLHQSSTAQDPPPAIAAAPEVIATLPFLLPKPLQLATPAQASVPVPKPAANQVTQQLQLQKTQPDATHAALVAHIQSLESQLASLTAHNTTLHSDLTSLRTLLTSTQTQLSDTQAQLAHATSESASLLRSAHDQLTTAASAMTDRDKDALAMHLSAARELDARSKQVSEREVTLNEERDAVQRERDACAVERDRVAGLAEDAGKVLAKALAREAEVGEWARNEMARVKAERDAVVAMREAVEAELSAQRAEVMAMRERVEVARAECAKQVEEERRAVARERAEVAKVRMRVEEEKEAVKKWKSDVERGCAEAAKAMELEANELARKAERVARDEAKVGVLMHKVQVAESRICVEREAVEDRAREVVRLLEDARGVYARAVAERREAARMHREADEWRRNGREGFEEEREKVKLEWEKVKEERKRVEVQIAELARKAVAQDPFAAHELALAAPSHQHQHQPMAPPSPVSPGQSAISVEDVDAAILDDCRPKVQYIPRRFHPAPSDISFDSMLSP
ncbi:hypothetical protein BCR44DRAFT_95954 [Catenaria anguillulae PL171]|uniref:Uncharacterized protein n=1 Tax=Catenaria anguillulae PL171 TaxID=765915 RepID=A0A1Y2HDT3_9FUNG|nr:hypothetical protein BCR44DRAFT_95954 [Catenaria anguillulae PL171]